MTQLKQTMSQANTNDASIDNAVKQKIYFWTYHLKIFMVHLS